MGQSPLRREFHTSNALLGAELANRELARRKLGSTTLSDDAERARVDPVLHFVELAHVIAVDLHRKGPVAGALHAEPALTADPLDLPVPDDGRRARGEDARDQGGQVERRGALEL